MNYITRVFVSYAYLVDVYNIAVAVAAVERAATGAVVGTEVAATAVVAVAAFV